MIYELNESVIPSIIHYNPKNMLSNLDSIVESVDMDCKSILEELKILDRPAYELTMIISEGKLDDAIKSFVSGVLKICQKIGQLIDKGLDAISFKIGDHRKFFEKNKKIILRNEEYLNNKWSFSQRYGFKTFEYNVFGNENSGLELLKNFVNDCFNDFKYDAFSVNRIASRSTFNIVICDDEGNADSERRYLDSDFLLRRLVNNKSFDQDTIFNFLKGQPVEKTLDNFGGVNKVIEIYNEIYDKRKEFWSIKKSLDKFTKKISKNTDFNQTPILLKHEYHQVTFNVLNGVSLYIKTCFKVLLDQINNYFDIIYGVYNTKIVEERATIPIHNILL